MSIFLLIIIINIIIIQYLFPTVATEEKKRKRFNVADADKDGLLNTDEVTSMFHPEERPHMFEVIIDVRFFFFPSDYASALALQGLGMYNNWSRKFAPPLNQWDAN